MVYQLPLLVGTPGLMHGFSTRDRGGEGNQRYCPENPKWLAIQNRAVFIRKVCPTIIEEFPFQVSVGITPFQKGFEEEVAIVGPADAGRGMTPGNSMPCEALVTDSPNLLLFIAVGDCIPFVMFDPRRRVLGLVHGGRESTIRKLPEKMLTVMREQFHTDPADVVVGMGPGFRSHYVEQLPAGISDPIWDEHIRQNGRATFSMDLFGYTEDRLIAAGVPKGNIEKCPHDTYKRADMFFSHRRSLETGETDGRHACAVGMVG